MKLLNTNETKWDKNIRIELTLKELQIIRDSMGATSHSDRSDIWSNYSEACPYNSIQGRTLFDDVKSILKKQGGVTFE